MIEILKRINKFIGIPKSEETAYTIFWKGALYGLASLSLLVMTLSGAFFQVGLPAWLVAGCTLILGIISFWLFRIVGTVLCQWITRIPTFVFALFVGTIGTIILARFIRFQLPAPVFYYGFAMLIAGFTFLGGSGMLLIKGSSNSKAWHIIAITLSLMTLGISIYFLAYEGSDPYKVSFEQTPASLLSKNGLASPGINGAYSTQYFTYGSGADKQRGEFRNGVKFKSQSVDATLLLPEWKDSKAKWRELYWGFGVKEFPINGRVWMPQGNEKFPIILIIHGNHGMEDHSDPGYTYLGELLASRGFITISVDENFVNGTWSGDFRGKEMPVRGWLLLKHLEQWRLWSNDNTHELYQKADLDNIILVGHSRGGEAAPIAAQFNKLSYFPDNAIEKFNFNFGIKGVIAIAPTDKRYDRRIELENINYLSIQGSYDSDEASFFGFRQYQRIKFNDSSFYFKAGLYVHGANHGQFNSTWGKYDGGGPFKWLLNTAPQMSMEEQQQIAKVYVSAFSETVMHQNNDYSYLFKNSAVAADWLPNKILLNTYKDSNTKSLITYEEDIDLTSGTIYGSTTKGINLKIWKEATLKFRDKDTQANNAAIIGWENDSTHIPASYSISLASSIKLDSNLALIVSMAQGDPKELRGTNKSQKKLTEEMDAPFNFQIQLMDSLGNSAAIDIIDMKKLTPRLKIKFTKLEGLSTENFGDEWEPTLEYFEIPVVRFTPQSKPLENVKQINFNFNRTDRGVLIIDEIGLNH